MSIELLIMNWPIYVVGSLSIFGVILIVMAGASYRQRSSTVIINPQDLTKYNRREKRLFGLGIVLIFIGLLGSFVILRTFGHYVQHTDVSGNVTIEKRAWPYKKDN